ncbi:MAG: shikimate kinase [Candidatus Euphemobacter frigidus]|nr:shikimate kinase [Candidatus Euphemobacter frigidus]MDP8275513.1 shikimate kinase [Candidatus Euphemobacter frigidus]
MGTEKNIVLFGFMGTGKSAIARLLGERLDRPVVEMDEVIEEQEGMTISRLFMEKGEAYFRNRERELVGELSQAGGKIIATGGGVILNPDNIRELKRNGVLICLTASPEVILKRVRDEVHRPLLEGGDRLEMIRKILEERRLLYDRIDHQIDTSDMTVEQVVEEIFTMAN